MGTYHKVEPEKEGLCRPLERHQDCQVSVGLQSNATARVIVNQQQVQWGRRLRQRPQYQCNKPTEAPCPLHLPNPAVIIISLVIHLFSTPFFTAESCVLLQNSFSAKYRRLIKKESHYCVHCPLTVHLFFSCVCLCVCVCV